MVMPRKRESETFRDVTLLFRNFSGASGRYNKEGDRNFSILLDEPTATELAQKGWNVKPLPPRDNEEEQNLYHLKVSVAYANRPPRCWLVTSGGRTMLGEGLIAMLDQVEYTRVDLTIVPYDWEVSGNSGRKAYLETLFFHMYESELEQEYADMPQVSTAGDGALGIAQPSFDSDGEN